MSFKENPLWHKVHLEHVSNEILVEGFTNLLTIYKPDLNGNILDIGCGASPFIINMIKGDFVFWAIDRDFNALENLKTRVAAINKEYLKKVKCVHGSFEYFSGVVPHQKFEAIILSNYLQFIKPENVVATISSIKKHSQKGTIWYLRAHSLNHPSNNNSNVHFQNFYSKKDILDLFDDDCFDLLHFSDTEARLAPSNMSFLKAYATEGYKGNEQMINAYLDSINITASLEFVLFQKKEVVS